jgi:hypothetical protein
MNEIEQGLVALEIQTNDQPLMPAIAPVFSSNDLVDELPVF